MGPLPKFPYRTSRPVRLSRYMPPPTGSRALRSARKGGGVAGQKVGPGVGVGVWTGVGVGTGVGAGVKVGSGVAVGIKVGALLGAWVTEGTAVAEGSGVGARVSAHAPGWQPSHRQSRNSSAQNAVLRKNVMDRTKKAVEHRFLLLDNAKRGVAARAQLSKEERAAVNR